MRNMIGFMAASIVAAGSMVVVAAPAFAGADDGQTKAFWSDQVGSAGQNGGQAAHPYMQMESRDAAVDKNASHDVDASNGTFNHAMGTMGGAGGAGDTGTAGQYTASYQHYMQMDPRDAKAVSGASQDVDAGNITFNHAKGTMSGN